MDPTSRRFKLLQLEFDADSRYVLDQIEQSATETSLRSMKYGGWSWREERYCVGHAEGNVGTGYCRVV
eukprot:scaffold82915_cov55-Cyclotella_meneghiniana.AAC.1